MDTRTLTWMDDAACRGDRSGNWFPDRAVDDGRRDQDLPADVVRALKVCSRCPVLEPCREYALDRNEKQGIWGGMTTGDRRRLKRAAQKRVRNENSCLAG